MLTAGSESLAVTVVTMVPLKALGATRPRYTDWLNAGEKSFMSCSETNTRTRTQCGIAVVIIRNMELFGVFYERTNICKY